MTTIDVKTTKTEEGWKFKVKVSEDTSTEHDVAMKKEDYEKLTQGKITPEQCVKKAFEFLLERESKESILGSFDIMLIGKYFPEFEENMRRAGFEPA